ncbi:MAG: adenylate/guanylate cyclase domain-containing protein [Coleofasciculaceae cyanobacterium]
MTLLRQAKARLKLLLWQWRGVWLTAPTMTGFVILLRLSGLLQAWEWAAFDQYMRWRPQLPPDDRIVIVGIEEADLRNIGQAVIPDQVYAELLKKLKARQPRAIGLDIYRDLPVPPGHQELVDIFQSTPNLVGIRKVIGNSDFEAVPPPPTLAASGQVGANDMIADADNKVRRGFIYLSSAEGEIVYSFGLYLALFYLAPEMLEETGVIDQFRLGKTVFSPLQTNEGGYVRADDAGYQLLLNYRGGAGHFETVSLTDILNDKVPADWGRDRIILIGAVGASFNDRFLTPYSGGLLSLPETMAGVEIQANMISQFISAAKGERPLIEAWSEPVEWLWILFWSTVGATLTWQWRYAGGVKSLSFGRTAAPFLVGGVLLGSTYLAFIWGWWLPVIPPFLALVGSSSAITAYVAYTAESIRKTFGRYLTDQVVTNLLENPEGLKIGGKRQKITIVTSDLRGFTALSEKLSPEHVVQILNIYLEHMLDVIALYKGTIDKFMGDGILVLFGAPTTRENDAERAVACAVAMQLAMTAVNKKMSLSGLPTIEMGIGINTGEVVVGNIGSEKHTEYTVIGNEINLAFRIETYTTGNQILISERTLEEIDSSLLRIDGQKQVKPKGVKQPINIYEIGGINGEYNLFLSKEEEVFLPITEEIPLLYQGVDDKQVSDLIFKGSLVKLSVKGAEVRAEKGQVDSMPSPLSNIKIKLLKLDDKAELSEDIYAKVLEKTASQRTFYIHFTFLPDLVATKINQLYKKSIRDNN